MKKKKKDGTVMDFQNDVMSRIRHIKRDARVTNEDLAARTGIPLGTLNKLLSGNVAEPKLSTVISICRALGCRLTDVIEDGQDFGDGPFIEKFRNLDPQGKELVRMVISKEYERCCPEIMSVPQRPSSRCAMIIPLYDLPVSAGAGEYLDSDSSESIKVELNDRTRNADFALRISGDSMNPKYSDGDIVLVDSSRVPETGSLGIFICDSHGYFKQYGGDRLISLNPKYGDILLSSFSDVSCRGSVLGKLKN